MPFKSVVVLTLWEELILRLLCLTAKKETNNPSFVNLTQAPTWPDFISSDNDDKYYFWDKGKGMLFFYMQQNKPPAVGFTPTGSCTEGSTDSACENAKEFYPCPFEGCVIYTVRVVDDNDEIGYKPTLGAEFLCDGGTLNGNACPATGVCPGGGICKPQPCKLCQGGTNKGKFCNDNSQCPDSSCVPSPTGESCYGATTCDDIYEGSTTPVSPNPPENYTQTYPPNDTVRWDVDMLALPDGRQLTEDKIQPTSDNMRTLKFCEVNGSIGKICSSDSTCGVAFGTDAQIKCIDQTINFPFNSPMADVKPSCPVNAP